MTGTFVSGARSCVVETQEELRAEAQRCRRLAKSVLDKPAAQGLIALAIDFERRADELNVRPRK